MDAQSEISQEVGIRAVCCPFDRRSIVLTVSQMPTFVVFQNGEKKGELVGASPPKLQVCTSIVQGVSACR